VLELDDALDLIAAAMKRAAAGRDYIVASNEATQHGLVEQSGGPASKRIWERTEGDKALRFQWRWYDPSSVYRTYPEINVLSAEPSQAGKILRSAEEHTMRID
jgi:hypothetical protein